MLVAALPLYLQQRPLILVLSGKCRGWRADGPASYLSIPSGITRGRQEPKPSGRISAGSVCFHVADACLKYTGILMQKKSIGRFLCITKHIFYLHNNYIYMHITNTVPRSLIVLVTVHVFFFK